MFIVTSHTRTLLLYNSSVGSGFTSLVTQSYTNHDGDLRDTNDHHAIVIASKIAKISEHHTPNQ